MSGLPNVSIAKKNKKDILRPPYRFRNDAPLLYVDTEQGLLRYTSLRRPRVHTTNLSSCNRSTNYIYLKYVAVFSIPYSPRMKKSRPGRSSDFFKVSRSSRCLDAATVIKKECKTILLKLQLRVQFRTRTGFPFQPIIHERMMNHL